MFLAGKRASGINYNNRFFTSPIIAAIFIFTFISGLRYGVGVDYFSYLKYFQQLQLNETPNFKMEPLFMQLSDLWAKTGFGYVFFFGFWALIQISLFYYGLKNRNYLYPFIGLVLVLGPYYLSWMNGIRQIVVCCAFVIMANYIVDRRFLKYLIFVLICSLIHKSAVLLIIFYFIPIKDFFSNRYVSIVILLLCAVLGQLAVIRDSLSFVEPVLKFIGYDDYAEGFSDIMDRNMTRAYGPRRLVLLATNLMIVWFSSEMKTVYQDKYFTLSYNMFFLYVCLSDLLSNVSMLFIRPLMYLSPFALIMTAYLLTYLKNKYGIYNCIFLIALILSCSYLFLDNIASLNDPNERSLYKSVLFEPDL